MADESSGTFDPNALFIRTYGPGKIPEDVLALRRAVYGVETGLLRDADMTDENDEKGLHLCLYYNGEDGEQLAAATHLMDAEASNFGHHSGVPVETLRQGFYSTRSIVSEPFRGKGLFSLMLYLAMREYRLKGRRYMFSYMEPGHPPGRKILRYSFISGVPPRDVKARDGKTYQVFAAWQDLSYALHRAFVSMPGNLQRYVKEKGILADEVERKVEARIAQFYRGPWFERLYAGTLTREQYVATLSNMHQFVRWTTRILGQLVGTTADRDLRRHYIEHLRGEIDHEVLLEKDLEHLGADVDYVVNHMVPLVEIQEFMGTQESAAAFRRNPVLFLAVPFAIEGLSGHITESFGPALARCIEGWGIDSPRRVTSFLTSHVHTDGGEDGHWEASRQMIRKLLTTEAETQMFLNVINLVMNSLDRAYAAYAAIPVFSATAADEAAEREKDERASAA